MDNCLFCNIVNGKIPSNFIYTSSNVVAFMDINPVAPFHCLVVPKEHYSSMMSLDPGVMAEVTSAIQIIAMENQLDVDGFRVVNNCGKYGQQTVEHVHFHLIGKRQFAWPPG
ncbi:MAG: HIT family protein [Candidatus Margulisbacteria bacterium]|nr:HIT family protein [Candidatus Margulisiibacteriota bacterium]